MNIAFLSAKKLAALIRRKKLRSVDLLDLYLERVARLNPKVNAVVVLDEKRAREKARKADRAAAKGNWQGPLHGVPMTVKESFDVEGLPTTWGRAASRGRDPGGGVVGLIGHGLLRQVDARTPLRAGAPVLACPS